MNIQTSLFLFFLTVACNDKLASQQSKNALPILSATDSLSYALKLSDAALSLTQNKVEYDGTYFTIPYPSGDVPANKGVCTDVIIRTYRKLGLDLQQKVHEDMQAHFSLYPQKWDLKKTDTNIDHRRVPNLMTFFSRFGKEKPISPNPKDFAPGDIVTWNLEGNLTHIGMVVNQLSEDKQRYLIVHNIGNGQELSDCLFSYEITGHYFYEGK